MSVENAIAGRAPSPAPGPDAPLAISVEGLHKSFRIPTQRVDSLKERAVHPFASREYRELHALNGISFDVRRGEFFGIVGRNGSGKSTLLKLLASIYRADSGRIRIAGRLAPFIELGVGFNQDLNGRENIVLNGVMMGLTPKQMRLRVDSVLDFAELREFAGLKLKNYSSGMLVRLAFSVMMEADADVLLIDEVLAVGDASFQQKCADAFHQMKAEGKTIVLVTHAMSTVEEYCHRAMLISDGQIAEIGEPHEVGRKYLRANFETAGVLSAPTAEGESRDASVKLLEARMVDAEGKRTSSVEHGEELRIQIEFEAKRDFAALGVSYMLVDANGIAVSQLRAPIGGDPPTPIKAGERFKVETTAPNLLAPGHYLVHCGINRVLEGGVAIDVPSAIDFVVYGGDEERGLISLPQETTTTAIGSGEA